MGKRTLWSLSGLALELNRNFRTVSRAIATIKPDGKSADGKPRWFLSTGAAALAEHERKTGRVPSRPVPERFDPVVEAQIAEIDASGKDVDQLLAKLRAEPNVERRRVLVDGGAGKSVGRHERALQATVGDNTHSALRQCYVDAMINNVLAEIAALCEWKVSPQ
jgi:hypothetical protein